MISVVVCTYNRAASLRTTLESLACMSVPPDLEWELIVVDNNSTDNTRTVVGEFLRTSGLNGRVVFEPVQGLCHARNRGIASAAGDFIAFTDDDVRVASDWLREIARAFQEFDCTGVAGKSIPVWNDVEKPSWMVTTGPYSLSSGLLLDFDLGDEAKEIQSAPWGLNMAFRKSAFEKHGNFRADLGVSGSAGLLGEDTEFGNRLLSQGGKIAYTPRAVVYHPVDERRITKSYVMKFHLRRGRTIIRLAGWPREAVLYFGVPRYMFRALLERCKAWVFTLRSEERLFRKAEVYFLVGQMLEARALQKGDANLSALRGSQRAY